MGNLTTFLYNYLTLKTSDPKSSIWLPRSLARYMPVTNKEPMALDTKDCKTSILSTMKTIYSGIVQAATDADPELQKKVFNEVYFLIDMSTEPKPKELVFSASDIVVNGIDNCVFSKLEDYTKDATNGYFLPIPVGCPGYDVQTYQLKPFSIKMNCLMEQTVCAYLAEEAQKGNYVLATSLPVDKLLPGNWPMCDLKLNVELEISLKESLAVKYPVSLNAGTTFCCKPDTGDRKLVATLDKILLSSDDLTDNISIVVSDVKTDFPEYKKVINGFVQDLFGYTGVLEGVIGSVVSTINQPDVLSKISSQLSTYVNNSFDSVLGEVTGELSTTEIKEKNAVDQYIFDRIRYSLCAPNGKYKLKNVIEGWDDPNLKDLQLGDIDLGRLGGTKGFVIDKLRLLQVEMEGLQNLDATIDSIGFILADEEHPQDLATMNPLLNLKIHGGLDLEMEGEKIDGTFEIDAEEAPFVLECVISGNDLDDLTITVQTGEITYKQGTIHITLDCKGRSLEFVDEILNVDGVLAKLVEKLNTSLSAQKAELSKRATEKIKQALKNAEA